MPPPIPAVINIISAPLRSSSIAPLSLSAAFLPISGSAPAPKPFVKPLPSLREIAPLASESAWVSVLAQIKSTPSIL